MTTQSEHIVEGWFQGGDQPALLGQSCHRCGTAIFPPVAITCPNPSCSSREFALVPLSRRGTVWSYTDAHYQPPAPYVTTTTPFEPFAIAAVELEKEKLVVLGQVASGYGPDDLTVGQLVELVLEPLEVRDGVEYLVWKWRPLEEASAS